MKFLRKIMKGGNGKKSLSEKVEKASPKVDGSYDFQQTGNLSDSESFVGYLDDNSYKLKIAGKVFHKLNAHDFGKAAARLHTEDCMWYFHDTNGELIVHEISVDDWIQQLTDLSISFPDFKFRRATLRADDVDGTVLMTNLVVTGTHTGKPYGFGPFEPVKPTGRSIVLDPEDAKIWFRNGKICKYHFYARGEMTGPLGMYTLAGGFPCL